MEQNYSTENYNDWHAHERDGALLFDPETHIYRHINHEEPLLSVTSFISSFFDQYDPYYWINKDERLSPLEKEEQKKIQDRKGFIARNLGTFMHTQIEHFFLGEPVEEQMLLSEGDEEPQSYSIAKEITYFRDFVMDHRLNPHRTEWMIYDDEHWLAGTLDLLVEEPNGSFTIYDWKRSRRMGREYGVAFYPNERNIHQSGHGVLSHLPDTPFLHAALQQNLYRYILSKHYGIEVEKMFLVILSPSFSRYHKVQVPLLQEEIRLMLES